MERVSLFEPSERMARRRMVVRVHPLPRHTKISPLDSFTPYKYVQHPIGCPARVWDIRSAMNPERKEFLNLRTLPARLDAEHAAWYLGCATHDIPMLIKSGMLKALGHPRKNCVKYFATATLQRLREDVNWLSRASDAITRQWQERKAERNPIGQPIGAVDSQ